MYKLYAAFGLIAAFALSPELGYLALAVLGLHYVHKKLKHH